MPNPAGKNACPPPLGDFPTSQSARDNKKCEDNDVGWEWNADEITSRLQPRNSSDGWLGQNAPVRWLSRSTLGHSAPATPQSHVRWATPTSSFPLCGEREGRWVVPTVRVAELQSSPGKRSTSWRTTPRPPLPSFLEIFRIRSDRDSLLTFVGGRIKDHRTSKIG